MRRAEKRVFFPEFGEKLIIPMRYRLRGKAFELMIHNGWDWDLITFTFKRVSE